MTDATKIKPSHIQRAAIVYVRQSTNSQVEQHRESTARQYALAERARQLGWTKEQVILIDEDLGLSGASVAKRTGFTRLTSEVALGRVGIVLGLEVSRLARNNADWYRLLDLCGLTDTLIGDGDGLYHPALFNDRLVLGLKGTMSEAELHIIRARLDGGIRNKAARGELRRGLPVGFVWGDEDGEVLFHPDEAITGAIRTVFDRFAELAYVYGKTRCERFVDEQAMVKKRIRRLPISEWAVLLPEHHPGFISWETFEANQVRIDSNVHPKPNQAGGAIREGSALLQGIAICGHCGRRLRIYYSGRNSTPGYYCSGKDLVNGRGLYCLNVGGVAIDHAVVRAFLDEISPAALEASLLAFEELQSNHDAALAQWRLEVERSRYEAERAERRYRAVEPENRLVARGLETEWENRLRDLSVAEAELHRREQQQPPPIGPEQRQRIHALAADLQQVWTAITTTDRDRKELLRTLLEDVIIVVNRAQRRAHLTMRWRGGILTTIELSLPRHNPCGIRTDEDTIELLTRLAPLYPDDVIAGILNRQGRKTAYGERFTANQVGSLRRYRNIPRFHPSVEAPTGELATMDQAAKILGVAPSTIHRWLNDGFIAGEQLTPGAPWRIRITDELRGRFLEETPPGFLPMLEATIRLGVSRQTILQRVKRGELEAVHVRRGRRKGLRIKIIDTHPSLFLDQS
jgi:DNA invertase Pin-like site-specific DNA recombinase/uncharacterized protein YndB with AHSA1/START domain